MKTCNICKIEKPLDQFYKHKHTKDKRQAKCKECEKAVSKRVRKETPGYFYRRDPEYYKAYNKKWKEENRERFNEIMRTHYHKVLKHKTLYKLRHSVGARVRKCLKLRGESKLGSAEFYIGCTYEQLIVHLEKQFTEGMTWDNYGKWEIDHIVPLSRGGSFHYTNLQPLWREDNLKKSNKIL
jgi:5-methylcytosine-specific restriction endonuclease McrA